MAQENHRPSMPGVQPPHPPSLDENIADNWRLFKQKWQNYVVITNLNARPCQYQVAFLLHSLGDAGLRIYNGFHFATPEEDRTPQEIIEQFDRFAIGETNETYERYVFNRRIQLEDESFEHFLSAIRLLIKSCNFCNSCIDSLLRDRIVLGIGDSTVQSALLRERKLTLTTCIDICKAAENATAHHRAIRPEVVHHLSPLRRVQLKLTM